MTSILLVDDDELFRTVLGAVLRRAGYQVQEVENGDQALKNYAVDPTDLVITDLLMPLKEGLETIQQLRLLYADIRIIAISGGERRGSLDYLKMATALGAHRTLSKPFSDLEILDAISEVLQAE